jgi:hypothetical protein
MGTLDENKSEIEESIRRKIKAANRAAKVNNYKRFVELYFDISTLFLELGNEEKAKSFNKIAKKYEAQLKLQEIINKYMNIAKEAYIDGNYKKVVKIYFQLADIIKKIDPERGQKFRAVGEKILRSKSGRVSPDQPHIPQIANTTPSESFHSLKVEQKSDLDDAFVVLAIVCPNCGKEVDPDSDFCGYCGTKIE